MITVLNISRIIVYLMILVILIVSVKTKSKVVSKNNLILSLLLDIYLLFSISIIPASMGLELGWSVLIHTIFISIMIIASVVSIIFNIKKVKTINEEILKENMFIKFYYLIFILIPVVIISTYYFYEKSLINNCDIFLEFEENIGIIDTHTYRYVAKKNSFKEVNMNYTTSKNKGTAFEKVYFYDLKINDNKELVIESTYNDPDLKEIDVSVVKSIYYDNNYKLNDEVVKNHNDSISVRTARLMKIVGSDYYIIEHHISNGDEAIGSYTLLGSALFKSNDFITDVGNTHGDFELAVVYK